MFPISNLRYQCDYPHFTDPINKNQIPVDGTLGKPYFTVIGYFCRAAK